MAIRLAHFLGTTPESWLSGRTKFNFKRINNMRFGYTIMYVPDVEAAINFYKNVFNLEQAFLHESKQYGELNTGETKLAFASEILAQSNDVSFVKNDIKDI